MCIQVRRKRYTLTIPNFLTMYGWSLHKKGYAIYTSRSKRYGIKRGAFMHREVIRALISEFNPFDLPDNYHVHHQNFNKLDCSPNNLVIVPQCLNTSPVKQDPHTGKMISSAEYERRYG